MGFPLRWRFLWEMSRRRAVRRRGSTRPVVAMDLMDNLANFMGFMENRGSRSLSFGL